MPQPRIKHFPSITRNSKDRPAISKKIVCIYFIASSAWISLSDYALGHITLKTGIIDPKFLAILDPLKGFLFVSATSLLLLQILNKYTAKIDAANARLEAAVKARTAELAKRNAEMEAFAYTVSHDLRSPVSRILSFAGFLAEQEDCKVDETGLHYVERIAANGKISLRVIETLLAIAVSKNASVKDDDVDLAKIIQGVISDKAHDGTKVGLVVETKLPAIVQGDEALLTTMIQNMIDNAIKYSSSVRDIIIKFGFDQEKNVYYVSDNGIGLDMGFANKIFDPFQRASRDNIEGYGIGLASVAKIIELHKGTIWVESTIDEGTTFYFSLNNSKGAHDAAAEEKLRRKSPD